MDRETDLRADYEELGRKLQDAEGSAAAAIVRERRLMSLELERISAPKEVALVDQLAERRARSSIGRPPARRRKSG
jgi:hypothetical protein